MTTPHTRTCLIMNARAAADDELRLLINALRCDGHDIEVKLTWEHEDATSFAIDAANRGIERIIAAGGDGTIHEVVQAMAQTDKHFCVGALPYGTGNDFFRTMYRPELITPPHLVLKHLIEAPHHPVDIGCLNGEHFMNAVSIGYGAHATESTPGFVKDVFGRSGYTAWGLLTLNTIQPFGYSLSTESGEFSSGKAWMIVVGNGRFVGGGFAACPKADLYDGKLDCTIIPHMSTLNTARAVSMLFSNDQDKHLSHELVQHIQMSSGQLSVHGDVTINADGEQCDVQTMEFEVVKRGISWLHLEDFPKGV